MTSHTKILPELSDIPNLDAIKELLIDQAYSIYDHVVPIRRSLTLKCDGSYTIVDIDDNYCKVVLWFNDFDGSTHVIKSEEICYAINL